MARHREQTRGRVGEATKVADETERRRRDGRARVNARTRVAISVRRVRVEFNAPAGTTSQKPKWFVSHWWGEPVMDFITCLEEHARVRALKPEDAVYCLGAHEYW